MRNQETELLGDGRSIRYDSTTNHWKFNGLKGLFMTAVCTFALVK